MNSARWQKVLVAVCIAFFSETSSAFFFFIPIPNLAKPAPLSTIIDALEKSEETKAVAYASEDKTFGSKFWVWGHYSGHVLQPEADSIALSRCRAALANAKSQQAGGKPLYDFGSKVCELHNFTNKTVSRLATEKANEAPVAPLVAPNPSMGSQASPAPDVQTSPVTYELVAPAKTASQASSASSSAPPAPSAPSDVSAPSTGKAAPAQPSSPSASAAQNEGPTAKRLRELNDLRKEGLISEQEYIEKRKAILSNM